MPEYDLPRRAAAEFLGTWMLVAAVVGSGIMAENLSGGNVAVALLGNTIATGAILVVLIAMLGPVSGGHFNPAVSLVFVVLGELPSGVFGVYVVAQVVGGVAGTITAHAMFDLPLVQVSEHARHGMNPHSSLSSSTLCSVSSTSQSNPAAAMISAMAGCPSVIHDPMVSAFRASFDFNCMSTSFRRLPDGVRERIGSV